MEGTAVIVTHTDIHRARAKFLTSLFDRFPVRWSGLDRQKAEGIGEDSGFYLTTGQYEAESSERRDAFLEALGAALVFLIDWNKARKDLRFLADGADCVRILDWAARNQIGHRAFLELGGSGLVAAAVRHAAAARIGFGERLSGALGREETVDFLKTVLRVSKEALLQGQSVRMARDEIEADLVRRFERKDNTLLTAIIRQAGLAREIAAGIGRQIADQQAGWAVNGPSLAALAQRIERKADRLVIEMRNTIARLDASQTILQLANTMEATIDELEQAAFIASLLPANLDSVVLRLIADLCAAAVGGAEALASGIGAAVDVPEGQHADTEDALAAKRASLISNTRPTPPSELRPPACFAAISSPKRRFPSWSLRVHWSGPMTEWRLPGICCTRMSWRTYRYEGGLGHGRYRSTGRGFLPVAERGRHRREGGESCSNRGDWITGSSGIRSTSSALR